MTENTELGTNWDSFVKMLLHRLDIPTKTDINILHNRLDKLEQLIYQKQSGAKKNTRRRTTKQKSASSIVLDVIANHPKGTDFKTIKAATGFDEKKLRNIIFRLDKIKKIQRVNRGIYKKI
ncbi:MAG: phasin family protein [Desulfobacteraceae bacterium]|nr:phasin family protein [Desulfobacteraceae bacterium]